MRRSTRAFFQVMVLVALAAVIALFIGWTTDNIPQAQAYHSKEEILLYKAGGGGGLPGGQNNWFMGSGMCEGCHGHDFNSFANVNEAGLDINLVDDWRSSMMANSARDPFWRAKVSHEILVNPAHQVALEDKCTSCHAPQGRFDKHLEGLGPYSISEMAMDPIALDGVSCLVCHRQSADSIGLFNSGNLKFDSLLIAWGPYDDNIFGSPMTSFVGFEPMYGAHINDAGLCAGCHTLITETVDLSGNFTGDHFVEQATYHEWVNSAFNDEAFPLTGITCQGCHIPRVEDSVVISNNYLFLDGRSPYGLHQLAGGNAFMLTMLRDHGAQLGTTASDLQFDSTIARTLRNLQQHSVLLDLDVSWRDADTAWIDVQLTNLTGHKFPSGYPSRRAWVELVVLDDAGDTLFKSGRWSSAYEVEGHDAEYEPHYDVINSGDQAQIYEMVMSDVNGDKTTVLERAMEPLKDNRLAPLGFSTAHYSYDTTLIAGVPATDIDFNHNALGVEGSGGDVVHYHVPMSGYTDLIHIYARVWYQSVPPLWNQEMFAYNSAEIDSFRTMYEAADNSPILVQSDSLDDLSVGIDDVDELGVQVFPNPVQDGWLNVVGLSDRIVEVEVLDVEGRLIASTAVEGRRYWRMRMPDGAATYLVVFRTAEKRFVKWVVVE